jgi:hypothetical protein
MSWRACSKAGAVKPDMAIGTAAAVMPRSSPASPEAARAPGRAGPRGSGALSSQGVRGGPRRSSAAPTVPPGAACSHSSRVAAACGVATRAPVRPGERAATGAPPVRRKASWWTLRGARKPSRFMYSIGVHPPIATLLKRNP